MFIILKIDSFDDFVYYTRAQIHGWKSIISGVKIDDLFWACTSRISSKLLFLSYFDYPTNFLMLYFPEISNQESTNFFNSSFLISLKVSTMQKVNKLHFQVLFKLLGD
jgi:hypothetical protein